MALHFNEFQFVEPHVKMTAVINLNKELILQQLNDGQYVECTQLLREEFKLVRNEENKPTP